MTFSRISIGDFYQSWTFSPSWASVGVIFLGFIMKINQGILFNVMSYLLWFEQRPTKVLGRKCVLYIILLFDNFLDIPTLSFDTSWIYVGNKTLIKIYCSVSLCYSWVTKRLFDHALKISKSTYSNLLQNIGVSCVENVIFWKMPRGDSTLDIHKSYCYRYYRVWTFVSNFFCIDLNDFWKPSLMLPYSLPIRSVILLDFSQ